MLLPQPFSFHAFALLPGVAYPLQLFPKWEGPRRQRLLGFQWDAVAGDEDGSGRRDVELSGVVALIDGDADAAAGVHVEQGLTDGDFHKSFGVRQSEGFLVEEQRDFVSEAIGEFLEFIAGNVGDERAEGVIEADNVTGDALLYASYFGSTA